MRFIHRNGLLIAIGVGVLTVAGLVVHGIVGGILLLLVAAVLVLLATDSWGRTRSDGQAVRAGIIALVVLVAVLKLAGKT